MFCLPYLSFIFIGLVLFYVLVCVRGLAAAKIYLFVVSVEITSFPFSSGLSLSKSYSVAVRFYLGYNVLITFYFSLKVYKNIYNAVGLLKERLTPCCC